MVSLHIIGIILGAALVVPLALDLMQKKPLGTNFASLGRGAGTLLTSTGKGASEFGLGVGSGIFEFVSRSFSPQIRPAFVPEIGFKLDVPCYGHQMIETPTYNGEYMQAVREGRMING